MNYRKNNLNELRQSARIVNINNGSRISLLSKRLLSKLITKLIVQPLTGQTHNQIMDEAVSLTMQMQAKEAEIVKEDLDDEVGYYSELMGEMANDKVLLVSNIAVCKESQSIIQKLSKKYNRLTSAPKRLLVAKNYLRIMKAFSQVHESIENEAKEQQVVIEQYEIKREAYASKNNEVKNLEERLRKINEEQVTVTEQLRKAKEELMYLRQDAEQFEQTNYNVINRNSAEPQKEVTPVPAPQPTYEQVNVVVPTPVAPPQPVPQPVVQTPTVNPVVENKLPGMVQQTEPVINNVQKVKVRVVNPKAVSTPVVNQPVEQINEKDETELSPNVLGQVNSFAMPTAELERNASQMPIFNPENPIPVQTEADMDFLAQMASFARQSIPTEQTNNFEAFGLESQKTR